MSKLLSNFCGKHHADFESRGVYDAILDEDKNLHVDPLLIKGTNISEFIDGYEHFLDHFRNVIRIAAQIQSDSDIFANALRRYLTFKELPNTGLGYGKPNLQGKVRGTGISGSLTDKLYLTTRQLYRAGITDPEIFALVPLFQEGFGADRISDMTICILNSNFLCYTERICKELNIPCQSHKIGDEQYKIPLHHQKPVIFIPKSFLCKLPMAKSWNDIEKASNYNTALRHKICKRIGMLWADFMKAPKRYSKDAILRDNSLVKDIIDFYKSLRGEYYITTHDDNFDYLKSELENCCAKDYPVNLHNYRKLQSAEDVYGLTIAIAKQYKKLIEDNRLYKLVYDEQGNIRSETYPQLLFQAVAASYCEANDIDFNRECDNGPGELDFKLSQGTHAKVIIEMKYSSNPKTSKGLSLQLPAYMKADSAQYGLLLVLIIRDEDEQKMHELYMQAVSLPHNRRTIIFVDARKKPSASKL